MPNEDVHSLGIIMYGIMPVLSSTSNQLVIYSDFLKKVISKQ